MNKTSSVNVWKCIPFSSWLQVFGDVTNARKVLYEVLEEANVRVSLHVVIIMNHDYFVKMWRNMYRPYQNITYMKYTSLP